MSFVEALGSTNTFRALAEEEDHPLLRVVELRRVTVL